MTTKRLNICALASIAAMITLVMLVASQSARVAGNSVTHMRERSLKLVAEYKMNTLEDVSTNGQLLLFYQTSTPMRTYTLPLDRSRRRANEPQVFNDVLRVVERGSGREIGRLGINSFPYNAKFVPDTQ